MENRDSAADIVGIAESGVSDGSVEHDRDIYELETDFTGGVRGKHHRAMQDRYSITVHQEDGTTVTKEILPTNGLIGDMIYSAPE